MPFNLNIDMSIFVGFLAVNLAIGLFYSRGIKNIREYAIGNRDFSTGTIVATLVATWISGSMFFSDISQVYSNGLFYIIPVMLGGVIEGLLICYFISPRMGEFLGMLSVADAMGSLYGQKARFITSLSSTIYSIGRVAAQFKVSATILSIFFGVSSFYATLASAVVVILYSTFGGIRAVTFTDVIQFFTFGTIIPIITLIIWGTFSDPHIVFNTISNNNIFDYQQLFNIDHPKFWGGFSICLYFLFPSIGPAIFQRISMAKDTTQVSNSYLIATLVYLSICIMFAWIGILLLSNNPNVEPGNLFAYMINNYTYVGFKGLIAIGIMTMVMSTADSHINAASINFSYDLRQSLGIKWHARYDLPFSYICSLIIGLLAFALAFHTKNLLDLLFIVASFYEPIVSVPLLFAIFGFRTSVKSVLIGMIGGFVTVLVWQTYFEDITDIESVIPGILGNMIFFFGSHYILRQPGGWVGIKDKKPLEEVRRNRKRAINNFVKAIKDFSFIAFCQRNIPRQEATYSFFGVFCIVSIFSTMYSLPVEIREHYEVLLEYIYHFVLISSTIFLTYPAWPPTFRSEKFIAVIWTLGIFSILVFVAGLLVAVSNFAQFQLMIFILNLVVIAMLLRWQAALFIIITGALASVHFFKWYAGIDNLAEIGNLQFKIMYSLLLVSSVLIAFIKPKQEYQELTEQKAEHLGEMIEDKDEEMERSLQIKNEFIRNLEHEAHTPITGITSMGQVLYENYDKLSKDQIYQGLGEIAKSSERLSSLVNNMIGLSKLNNTNSPLNKQPVNLSELVYERLDYCKKLYLNGKFLEFITNVEDGVVVLCDRHYIQSTLDNLIVNAIQYSKKGTITLELHNLESLVEFSVKDEGVGIPKTELYDIFRSFAVSSKTKTPAGGRGVGLALCKKAIEMHGGEIEAESDGVKGAKFVFTLPQAVS